MNIQNYIIEKAKSENNTIVLPEGNDSRIIKAAAEILKQNIAEVIILGNESDIYNRAQKEGVNIEKAKIINIKNSNLKNEFVDIFYQLRKHKGITRKEALEIIDNPLYFGTMLVHTDRAQGMVAGADNLTKKVLKPAFQIIKTKPDISIVSGSFIMNIPGIKMGNNGVFIFADCAVNPNPDKKQLAEIAITSAETAETLLNIDPVVAMLSFSTKGSASHNLVKKVKEATEIAKNREPDLKIEGELQADAAIVPEVANSKAPDSQFAGRANVLIFPDLQAGNIGYKLVQRLAGAEAIGPVLQGIAKPINDLSRGCTIKDIINVVAITSIQSSTRTAVTV